ncbi:putative aldouronate transport system substrate-binding protein [Anaerotaenia torta]|uniref:extracellular solute-binding protein n=1 Tax=Anaerotaenia torta TaxID=433293 RepID=UPI003D2278D5
MKKIKKVVTVLLTLSLLVSMLAGCKKDTNETGNKAPDTQTTGDSSTSKDSKDTEKKQTITLKALVPNNGGMAWNDGEANPVLKWLTDITGYKVEYDILPADNPNDKLNAIMAAGADYDFIIINDKSRYAEYASQGALMDMKPLVEQYAPNVASSLNQTLIDICTVGDTYYAIPNAGPSGRENSANVNLGIIIRTDLLNKIGLSMPATLDDFTSMLQAFKDKDPQGKGSANVPFSLTIGDLDGLRTSAVGGAFGIDTDWKDVNGELVPYQLQDGFYDYLVYLNELYSKGLMDPEMPTNQSATVLEKFTTDLALCRVDGYWSVPSLVDTFKNTNPDGKVEFIQPLEKDGQAGTGTNSKNQIDTYVVIPKNAKNVEATMDYINQKLDPEVFKEMVIGTEGTDYTVDENGEYVPVLPTFFNNRGNAQNYLTGTNDDYGNYWLCRARKDANQFAAYSQLNYTYGDFVHVNPASDIPCSVYTEISTDITNSKSLTEEFVVNAIVFGVTQDDFGTFQSNWKSQCGEKLIAAYNNWYQSK